MLSVLLSGAASWTPSLASRLSSTYVVWHMDNSNQPNNGIFKAAPNQDIDVGSASVNGTFEEGDGGDDTVRVVYAADYAGNGNNLGPVHLRTLYSDMAAVNGGDTAAWGTDPNGATWEVSPNVTGGFGVNPWEFTYLVYGGGLVENWAAQLGEQALGGGFVTRATTAAGMIVTDQVPCMDGRYWGDYDGLRWVGNGYDTCGAPQSISIRPVYVKGFTESLDASAGSNCSTDNEQHVGSVTFFP